MVIQLLHIPEWAWSQKVNNITAVNGTEKMQNITLIFPHSPSESALVFMSHYMANEDINTQQLTTTGVKKLKESFMFFS